MIKIYSSFVFVFEIYLNLNVQIMNIAFEYNVWKYKYCVETLLPHLSNKYDGTLLL